MNAVDLGSLMVPSILVSSATLLGYGAAVFFLSATIWPRIRPVIFAERGKPRRWRGWWKKAVVATLLVGAFAGTAMGALSGLLKAMHLPSEPSAGALDLISVRDWRTPALGSREVVLGWRNYSEAVNHNRPKDQHFATGQAVTSRHILIDSIGFAPAYIGLITLLLLRAAVELRRVNPSTRKGLTGGLRNVALSYTGITRIGFVSLLGVTLADYSENAAAWFVARGDWLDPSVALALAPSALLVLTIVKLVAFGVSVVSLILLSVALVATHPTQWARLRASLRTMRPFILLSVFFGATLLIPEAALDLIRAMGPGQVAWSVGLTLLLAYTVFELGRRLLVSEHAPEIHRHAPAGSLVRMEDKLGQRVRKVAEGIPRTVGRMWRRLDRWLRPPVRAAAGAVGSRALSDRLSSFRAHESFGTLAWSGVLAVVGFVFPLRGLLIPAALLGGIALLSLPIRARQDTPKPAGPRAITALPQIVGGGIVAALGLAMVRATAGQLAYAAHIDASRMWGILVVGGLLPFCGWQLFDRLGTWLSGSQGKQPGSLLNDRLFWRVVAVGLVGLGIALAFGIILDDGWWRLSEGAGSVGIIAGFAIVASALIAAVSAVTLRMRPAAIFQALGLKRVPVFALLLTWLVLATTVDRGGFHDIRRLQEQVPSAVAAFQLDEAWSNWLARNGLDPESQSALVTSSVPATPMMLIATSGGGIRSAFWTGIALDCLLESSAAREDSCEQTPLPGKERSDRSLSVFAASGISGGSLGLVEYLAYLDMKADNPEKPVGARWVGERLGGDYTAATLARELFIEFPRAFIRFPAGMDRAEALERAWERSWPSEPDFPDGRLAQGLLGLQREHPEFPLLLLNGTSVHLGCRFTTSALDIGMEESDDDCYSYHRFRNRGRGVDAEVLAATQDLVDFMCPKQDVALSTAALLSARFPVISPAGRVPPCPDGATTMLPSYVVDGGYLDTSAASTVSELWLGMQARVSEFNRLSPGDRCVAPFMVQIDNGYEDVVPLGQDQRPAELTAPLSTSNATRGGRAASATAAAALLFSQRFDSGGRTLTVGGWPVVDRYAQIVPQAHPGVEAPLSWTLSNAAQLDLQSQLAEGINPSAVAEVHSWFEGGFRCSPLVTSSSFQPERFDLGHTSLDLNHGWVVTDEAATLSLYRSDAGAQLAGTVLSPGVDVSDLADREFEAAKTACGDDESCVASRTGPSQVEILAGSKARRVALAPRISDPDGFGSRAEWHPEFVVGAGQTARIALLKVGDYTVVVAVTSDRPRDLNPLVREVQLLLAPLGEPRPMA